MSTPYIGGDETRKAPGERASSLLKVKVLMKMQVPSDH